MKVFLQLFTVILFTGGVVACGGGSPKKPNNGNLDPEPKSVYRLISAEVDNGNDGTVDTYISHFYDSSGRVIRSLNTSSDGSEQSYGNFYVDGQTRAAGWWNDDENDGDYESIGLSAYDSNGDISESRHFYNLQDGQVLPVFSDVADTIYYYDQYNSDGYLLVTSADWDADTVIDYVLTNSYDSSNKRLTTEVDFDGDTSDIHISYMYDSDGKLDRAIEVNDGSGNTSTTTYQYDSSGVLVRKELDRESDGFIDSSTTYVFEEAVCLEPYSRPILNNICYSF